MPTDNKFSKEELRAQTEKLLHTALADGFLEGLSTVLNAPRDKQMSEAAHRLTPDTLREHGVPIPEDMRISARYFEDPAGISLELGPGQIDPAILESLKGANEKVFQALRETDPQLHDSLSKLRAQSAAPSAGVCACVGVPPGVCAGIGSS